MVAARVLKPKKRQWGPPKNGSLRQAALACGQRQQAVSASPVSITQSVKKRPLPNSPKCPFSLKPPSIVTKNNERHSNWRKWIRIPREGGTQESPSPWELSCSFSPLAGPPAPLVFTPSKILEDAEIPAGKTESEVHEGAGARVVENQLPPLPLCHYCCHRGSGKDPVHYFMQCVCDDWPCTCWCYCTEAQLEH